MGWVLVVYYRLMITLDNLQILRAGIPQSTSSVTFCPGNVNQTELTKENVLFWEREWSPSCTHREEVKLTQFQNWSLRDGEGEKIDRNITSIGFQWWRICSKCMEACLSREWVDVWWEWWVEGSSGERAKPGRRWSEWEARALSRVTEPPLAGLSLKETKRWENQQARLLWSV